MEALNYRGYIEKIGAVFLSAAIAILITFLFLAVFAFAMLKGSLSSSVESVGLIVISVLSCFAGGFLSGRKNTKKRYLWGLFTGLLYCLFFFLMRIFLGGTDAENSSALLTALLYCAGAGMLGGMLS